MNIESGWWCPCDVRSHDLLSHVLLSVANIIIFLWWKKLFIKINYKIYLISIISLFWYDQQGSITIIIISSCCHNCALVLCLGALWFEKGLHNLQEPDGCLFIPDRQAKKNYFFDPVKVQVTPNTPRLPIINPAG